MLAYDVLSPSHHCCVVQLLTPGALWPENHFKCQSQQAHNEEVAPAQQRPSRHDSILKYQNVFWVFVR